MARAFPLPLFSTISKKDHMEHMQHMRFLLNETPRDTGTIALTSHMFFFQRVTNGPYETSPVYRGEGRGEVGSRQGGPTQGMTPLCESQLGPHILP